MPLIEMRSQVALAIEGVEGTSETLAASDAVLAENIKFEQDVKMTERKPAALSLSPFPAVPGSRTAKVTFDVMLHGSGTAGTAPDFGVALQGCGLAETVVAATSVTYAPASAAIPSLTIGVYKDGKRFQAAGARGTVKLEAKAGEPAKLSFEFTGVSTTETDTALLTGVAYQTAAPPAFLGASLALGTYAAICESVGIDLANTIALRPDVNSAGGYASTLITARAPKLTLNPEAVLCAAKDWYSAWVAGTQMAFTAVIGGAAGNKCTVSAPKAQIATRKMEEREGVVVDSLELGLFRDTGDDELELAFT